MRRSVREGGFLKKPPSLTLHSAKLFSEHFAVEMLLESSGARLRRAAGAAAVHLRRIGPEYGVLALLPVSRDSLAAYISGGGVKPAGQDTGSWLADIFNNKMLWLSLCENI